MGILDAIDNYTDIILGAAIFFVVIRVLIIDRKIDVIKKTLNNDK